MLVKGGKEEEEDKRWSGLHPDITALTVDGLVYELTSLETWRTTHTKTTPRNKRDADRWRAQNNA